MAPSGINLNSGDLFSATITYNGTALTESLTDTARSAFSAGLGDHAEIFLV
jgi:hypothetical protein